MTPKQEEVIAFMAWAMAADSEGLEPGEVPDERLIAPYADDVNTALRAAREHGYVMAKIPDHKQQPTAQGWDHISGWNMAVDAIETIEIEE